MIVHKLHHSHLITFSIPLLITILQFHLTTTANPRDPGWARFCGITRDQQYVSKDFFTDKCPAGVWLNASSNEVQWNCLCTMGSFALRFGWCNQEQGIPGLGSNGLARFTPTDISCVHFDTNNSNQRIHGLQSLHKWSNRYKEDGPYIWTKESGGAILSHRDFKSTSVRNVNLTSGVSTLYALRVNPKPNNYYSIYSKKTNRAVCLLPPNGTKNDGVLFGYQINFLWTDTEKPDKNGNRRRLPKNVKLEFVSKPGCYFTDDSYSFKAILPKNMDDLVLPKLSQPDLHPDCIKCLSDQSPFVDPVTEERSYPVDLDNITNLNHEVNLQTERIAIHWGDILLRNQSKSRSDMMGIQEVEILRQAAIMAYGACGMNLIPRQFYKFFLILFEAILSESFLKYPPQSPLEDKVHLEISTILQTCMNNTILYNMTVDESCPPIYSEYNEPGVGYMPIETPPDFMANPEKHDYILEFIWKLISFLHYHCHDEFRNAPALHDTLQNQFEQLFQEDLLLRWSHPSNSLRMLENMFKVHLDVVVTMINFEKCVSVANKKNKYEGWIKKPISQPYWRVNTRRRKRSVDTRRPQRLQYSDRYVRKIRPRTERLDNIDYLEPESYRGYMPNQRNGDDYYRQPVAWYEKEIEQNRRYPNFRPPRQTGGNKVTSLGSSTFGGGIAPPPQLTQDDNLGSDDSNTELSLLDFPQSNTGSSGVPTKGPSGGGNSGTGPIPGDDKLPPIDSNNDAYPVLDIPEEENPGGISTSSKPFKLPQQGGERSSSSPIIDFPDGQPGDVTGSRPTTVLPQGGDTGSRPIIDFQDGQPGDATGSRPATVLPQGGDTGSRPIVDFPEPGPVENSGMRPVTDDQEGTGTGEDDTDTMPVLDLPDEGREPSGGNGGTVSTIARPDKNSPGRGTTEITILEMPDDGSSDGSNTKMPILDGPEDDGSGGDNLDMPILDMPDYGKPSGHNTKIPTLDTPDYGKPGKGSTEMSILDMPDDGSSGGDNLDMPILGLPDYDKPGGGNAGSGFKNVMPTNDKPDSGNGIDNIETMPVLDLPDGSNSGGTGNPNINIPIKDSSGTGYVGPTTDISSGGGGIEGSDNGARTDYKGSKSVLDFPEDDIEDQGKFKGSFACLFSMSDFSDRNRETYKYPELQEYPDLYSDKCWDHKTQRNE